MRRRLALALATAVTLATLAACGSSGDSGDGTTAAPKGQRIPPSAILSAVSTKQLGTVVVDGAHDTLYRFDEDSARPSTATCTGECATTWPPVIVDPNSAPILEGVDADAVGFVTRDDGTEQVTIAGWPVYRHVGDGEPAGTEGHGVDGTWFAITPDGDRAEER